MKNLSIELEKSVVIFHDKDSYKKRRDNKVKAIKERHREKTKEFMESKEIEKATYKRKTKVLDTETASFLLEMKRKATQHKQQYKELMKKIRGGY